MAKLRTRHVGSSSACCRRCGELSTLTVRETRYVRTWSELLSTSFDPAISRSARCAACATTYPVRSTDYSAAPAAMRRDEVEQPTGRDWAYTSDDDERRRPEPTALQHQ